MYSIGSAMQGQFTMQNHSCKNCHSILPDFAKSNSTSSFFCNVSADCCCNILGAVPDPSHMSETCMAVLNPAVQ